MSERSRSAFVSAREEIVKGSRERLARLAVERRRRRLVRLIDQAIGLCERVNLDASSPDPYAMPPRDLPAPESAAALVELLQVAAGEPRRRPATNQQALDELFRLQEPHLVGVGEEEEVAEAAEEPS